MKDYVDISKEASEAGIKLPVYLDKNIPIFPSIKIWQYESAEDRVDEIIKKLKVCIEISGNKKRVKFYVGFLREFVSIIEKQYTAVELEAINNGSVIKVKKIN